MKLRHIDALRGVAVLLVILVHTASTVNEIAMIPPSWLWICNYGQMGVQLFFVISAFTLYMSHESRQAETHSIKAFFIRRIFRIAPLYYVGIALYFGMSVYVSYRVTGSLKMPERYSWQNVLANMTFIHGLYPPANNNIVPGGWSIGTEMLFYAIFPFLFVMVCKFFERSAIWLVALPLLAASISIGSQHVVRSMFEVNCGNNTFVYFNIINQLPVFLLGMSLYYSAKMQLFRPIPLIAYWVAFLCLTLVGVLFLNRYYFGVQYAIIPLIAGVSFCLLFKIFEASSFLTPSWLVWMGQVSYSAYVFHYVFARIVTSRVAVRCDGIVSSECLLVLCYLLAVLGTFVAALIAEKYLERPFIGMGRNIIAKLK